MDNEYLGTFAYSRTKKEDANGLKQLIKDITHDRVSDLSYVSPLRMITETRAKPHYTCIELSEYSPEEAEKLLEHLGQEQRRSKRDIDQCMKEGLIHQGGLS